MVAAAAQRIDDVSPVDVRPSLDALVAADRAFGALVTAQLPALSARARQLCRGHLDPDDIVQDALVRAFDARGQLRDPARVRPWLLAIVHATFIDALRRQRRRPVQPLDEEAVEVAPEEPREPLPWERVTVDDLRAAVAALPDDVRDTYRMFALEGRSYVDIASALGVPKATVGTRILRARKRLRELLAAAIEGRR